MANSTRAALALIFTIFVWGVAPVFARTFSLKNGPADAIVIRMCFTALAVLPLFLYSGWRIDRADIPKLLVVSIIGMFGYFLGSVFGYKYLPAGFGSMIIAVQPLLIAVIAALVGSERITLNAILGLAISFVGTLYLFSGNMDGDMTTADMIKGGLLFLVCDLAWAIYVVFSKPLLQKYGTIKMTGWTLLLCAPPALVFVSGSTWPAVLALNGQAYAALFFLTVINVVVCVITWNFATTYLNATTMGAALYVIPVLAVLSGWQVLHEKLTSSTLVAGFVILLGVGVAEFGKSRKSA
jgi:drug/metabolite transporter (DMT)-like permease